MSLQGDALDAAGVRSYAFAAGATCLNARTTFLLTSHREGRAPGFAVHVRNREDRDTRAESEAGRGFSRIGRTRLAATGAGYSVAEVEVKLRWAA